MHDGCMDTINHFGITQHVRSHLQLRDLGYSDTRIHKELKDGTLYKIMRNVYIDGVTWRSWDENQRTYAMHYGYTLGHSNMAFSHMSAAFFHGLDTLYRSQKMHIIPLSPEYGGTKSSPLIMSHRSSAQAQENIIEIAPGIHVTDMVHTAVDCAKKMSLREGLVVVDSALRTNRAVYADYQTLKEALSNARGHGCRKARALAELMSPASGSAAETLARLAILQAGLPRPQEQYVIYRENGRRFYLDFAWPELGLFLEIDGKKKYLGQYGPADEVLYQERQRENEIKHLTGWTCIRARWEDIFPDPSPLIARLQKYI